MTLTTHLAAGFAAIVLLKPGDPVSAAAVLVGSVLPDVDHPGYSMRALFPFPYRLARLFLRRRGMMHSLLGLALVCMVAWWLGLVMGNVWPALRGEPHGARPLGPWPSGEPLTGLALSVSKGPAGYLALGYVLHLGLDALNPSKLPLLWPAQKRWGIGLVRGWDRCWRAYCCFFSC